MGPDSRDEKLDRILRDASVVFAEKGYHQASIRDIARATDISLSSLYYYVSSKEELLYLIQRHCLDTLLERARQALEDVEDPEERLRTLVRTHLRFFVSNMAEMKVLSHEAESLTGEYRAQVIRREKEYTKIAYDILASLAPDDTATDLRVATFSLFGMMNWIYNWYRPERDVGVERLVADMLHLFLHGYRAGPGGHRGPGSSTEERGSLWESS